MNRAEMGRRAIRRIAEAKVARTEPKHTPGPWHVWNSFFIGSAGREPIAHVKTGIDPTPAQHIEAQFNARLIAAAPELAAALDRLLAASDAYRENALPKNQVDLVEASIAAKDALRKAGVL